MSEETNKKQNEEISDEKLESAVGGFRMLYSKCPVCGMKLSGNQRFCSEGCRQRYEFRRIN